MNMHRLAPAAYHSTTLGRTLCGWGLLLVVLIGSPAVTPAAEENAALSVNEIVDQATLAGADGHRVAARANGDAKIFCALQAMAGQLGPNGLDLQSVGSAEGAGAWSVRVLGLGRQDAAGQTSGAIIPEAGTVSVNGGLARLNRSTISEEVSSSAGGIRQDFLIHQRPVGDGQLSLELALSGTAIDEVAADQVQFSLPAGRRLAWHALHVTDADDRVLAARFEANGADLRIVVDDSNASYPIRIDPTFTDMQWFAFGAQKGVLGTRVLAMVVYQGDLVIGGEFSAAGNVSAHHIARWDGSAWHALDSGETAGLDNTVMALAASGTDLFVGGWFSNAGGVAASHIARWDGSTWQTLGEGSEQGVDESVSALVMIGSDLFVGGYFAHAGTVPVNHVARWDGSEWHALGEAPNQGVDGGVTALAISDSNHLFVGGGFTNAGGQPASHVARWDGSDWHALGAGLNSTVLALAASGTDLFVGGQFTSAGGQPASKVAHWNGSDWQALPGEIGGTVRALAVNDANLFVGGWFSSVDGVPANGVARWDRLGAAWQALDDGSEQGVNEEVSVLALWGTDLFVGGEFTAAGGVGSSKIARWDGSSWHALGDSTIQGLDEQVRAMAVSGSNLFVGGRFSRAGGVEARRLARWDGSQWHAVGNGDDLAESATVYALAVRDTDLFVGGEFTAVGGVSASNIIRWDRVLGSWHALDDGTDDGVSGSVQALALADTGLFVGGYFSSAGKETASYIARWDGSAWYALGEGPDEGVNDSVQALAVSGTNLFVGGRFDEAGSEAAKYIARWNGSNWYALGDGVNHRVHALAVLDSDLFVGGRFSEAGGQPASHVARWDGSAWHALGNGAEQGVDNTVDALAIMGSYLFVGGLFTSAGGAPASHVARWNGSAWHALAEGSAEGVNHRVYALAASDTDLFIGGRFTMAGGKFSTSIARASRHAQRIRSIILGIQSAGEPLPFDAEIDQEPLLEPTPIPPDTLRFRPLRRDLNNTVILTPAEDG